MWHFVHQSTLSKLYTVLQDINYDNEHHTVHYVTSKFFSFVDLLFGAVCGALCWLWRPTCSNSNLLEARAWKIHELSLYCMLLKLAHYFVDIWRFFFVMLKWCPKEDLRLDAKTLISTFREIELNPPVHMHTLYMYHDQRFHTMKTNFEMYPHHICRVTWGIWTLGVIWTPSYNSACAKNTVPPWVDLPVVFLFIIMFYKYPVQ